MRTMSVHRSFSGQSCLWNAHRNFMKMKLRDDIRSLCQGLVAELASETGIWVVAYLATRGQTLIVAVNSG